MKSNLILIFTLFISKLSIQHQLPEIMLVDLNNDNTMSLIEMIKAISTKNDKKIPINVLTISNQTYQTLNEKKQFTITNTRLPNVETRLETTTLSLFTFIDQIKSATASNLELITSIKPLETTTLELITLQSLKMLSTTTLELKISN